MELIPILSTIILVATIATFLLAIGAYILYKVRGQQIEEINTASPSAIDGELVTPSEGNLFKPVGTVQQRLSNISLFSSQPEMDWRGERLSGFKSSSGIMPPEGKHSNQVLINENSEPKYLKYSGGSDISSEESSDSGELKWR